MGKRNAEISEETADRVGEEGTKPNESSSGGTLAGRKSAIGEWRGRAGRITDEHMPRYVKNWMDTVYNCNDWGKGRKDSLMALMGEGINRTDNSPGAT